MRFRILTSIGVALTLGCAVLYIFEPAFVQIISLKSYDFLLSQVNSPAKSGKVVIIDIDEASLARYGQWPWSRYRVAELTDRIFEAGASVVGFDVFFPEQDRTSPEILIGELNAHFGLNMAVNGLPESLSNFDSFFARSLAGRNTILGCFMHPAQRPVPEADAGADRLYRGYFYFKGSGNPYEHVVQASGLTLSIPSLSESAGNNAFINTFPDSDNVVRSTPLVWACGPTRVYPSLALEAVRMYSSAGQIGIIHDENGMACIRLKDIVVPTDGAGRTLINFRTTTEQGGFMRSLPWISAAKVLAGELDENRLRGKIVFVGTSATGLHDLRATPLTAEFAGVEIHASVIDNILAGDVLIHPRWMRTADLAAILFFGCLLTIIIARGRSWLSFLYTIALIMAAVWGSLFLLRRWQLVFMPTWPVIAILLVYMILTMVRFWQEERRRHQVRAMFGTMVSQEVLRYLEGHPELLLLSGQKADATMFFSDVASFTTISENLAPEKLSDLLNRYLSPMTSIIMNRKGYVDKYEGDAIMAEWGVPFQLEDHALQACLAAIEQQEALEVLRPILERRFGHVIHVRMGINSGRVTAGNMGSERRQQFTVMGDAVNQAARLEPVNKEYGTRIVIGESTYNLAKDAFETRMLDKIVVVGKTQPVHIYELIGRKGSVASSRMEAAALYEEALKLHWERRWDEAQRMLEKARAIEQDEGAIARLKKRIADYRASPPPQDWAGEYVRTAKD